MFALAFFLGILSYSIFLLGILHFLYPFIVITITIVFFCCFAFVIRKRFLRFLKNISFSAYSLSGIFVFLIILQTIVNSIGALGPEMGFDALWYHLTLPKIYLFHNQIFHIPQSLFYYSDMPKLIEMLYIPLLATGDVILPKILEFLLSILCCTSLYFLAKKYTSHTFAFAAVVIFYANLVVGWESISGYIDLGRTFFEILALWTFVNWEQSSRLFWLICTACMIGFAISSKLLAFGTLGIFIILIFVSDIMKKKSVGTICQHLTILIGIAILIPSPWMVFSWIHTGNPVYPFFSSLYPISPGGSITNLTTVFSNFWTLFTSSADPISPIYLAFLPLILLQINKAKGSLRFIYLYSLLALFVWYITPRTGGGRFILPYLPAFSILAAWVTETAATNLKFFMTASIILVSCISIGYRTIANAKFIPVLIGKQTTSQFLTTHLNFSFGDFYDTDGFFAKHITSRDMVLLLGFHNLFYADFPFTLDPNNKQITYIAIQKNGNLPIEFGNWRKIYRNTTTHVRVYHE